MLHAILAPVLLLAVLASSDSPAQRKCPNRTLGTAVFLDGVRSTEEATPASLVPDPDDIYSIWYGCMSLRDSTFNQTGDGMPAVSIWTKQGVVQAAKRTLARVLDAQDARSGAAVSSTSGATTSRPPPPNRPHS